METGNNGLKSLTEVEVVAKGERRRFTAQYKLKVLREAEHCKEPGEIGGLLRREGLYWSNLTNWRKQRERGELVGLSARKRGPQRREKNSLAGRVRELERDNLRLKRRAERAEGIVELQKKVSEILKGKKKGSGVFCWFFCWQSTRPAGRVAELGSLYPV